MEFDALPSNMTWINNRNQNNNAGNSDNSSSSSDSTTNPPSSTDAGKHISDNPRTAIDTVLRIIEHKSEAAGRYGRCNGWCNGWSSPGSTAYGKRWRRRDRNWREGVGRGRLVRRLMVWVTWAVVVGGWVEVVGEVLGLGVGEEVW